MLAVLVAVLDTVGQNIYKVKVFYRQTIILYNNSLAHSVVTERILQWENTFYRESAPRPWCCWNPSIPKNKKKQKEKKEKSAPRPWRCRYPATPELFFAEKRKKKKERTPPLALLLSRQPGIFFAASSSASHCCCPVLFERTHSIFREHILYPDNTCRVRPHSVVVPFCLESIN